MTRMLRIWKVTSGNFVTVMEPCDNFTSVEINCPICVLRFTISRSHFICPRMYARTWVRNRRARYHTKASPRGALLTIGARLPNARKLASASRTRMRAASVSTAGAVVSRVRRQFSPSARVVRNIVSPAVCATMARTTCTRTKSRFWSIYPLVQETIVGDWYIKRHGFDTGRGCRDFSAR